MITAPRHVGSSGDFSGTAPDRRNDVEYAFLTTVGPL